MTRISAALLALVFAAPGLAQTPQTFVLTQSTLSYHMVHPVDGVSHAARGKGVCSATVCEFLVAAPVKSFGSGDTNRDEHMIQVTRGAEFPVVTVRLRLPASTVNAATLDCDLDVNFASQTAHFAHVPFQQTVTGNIHTSPAPFPPPSRTSKSPHRASSPCRSTTKFQ